MAALTQECLHQGCQTKQDMSQDRPDKDSNPAHLMILESVFYIKISIIQLTLRQ